MCLFLRMEIEKGEIFSEADQSHDLYADFIVCFIALKRCYFQIRCRDIFRAHLRVVKANGITPFVVFDGLPLPAKASEDERRQR